MELLELRGASCAGIPDCSALQLPEDQQVGLNEVFLYHGCRSASISSIVDQGFQLARSGDRNGRFFGREIYFSDFPSKADTYVDVGPDGSRCLLITQVCLGEVLLARKAMPCLEAGTSDDFQLFDSVLGEDKQHQGVLDHREFVIYHDSQALPRYLLWYRHCQDCTCFRCRSRVPPTTIKERLLPALKLPVSSEANCVTDEGHNSSSSRQAIYLAATNRCSSLQAETHRVSSSLPPPKSTYISDKASPQRILRRTSCHRSRAGY